MGLRARIHHKGLVVFLIYVLVAIIVFRFALTFSWVEKALIGDYKQPVRLNDGKAYSSSHTDQVVPWLQYDASAPCKPLDNILFLKTHKTGSSTLTNILNRFGDKRNLTFALPAKTLFERRVYDFNWPDPFQLKYSMPSDGAPNILCNHARYNKAPMHWLFPKETTRYITMLREPTAQFESIFNYYPIIPRLFGKGKTGLSPLENFLQNTTFYMEQVKFRRSLNLIKNPALFDLGLDRKDHENFTVVRNYIRFLQQEFDLVMLMEYFDESLVLLKRRFCWQIKDILYFKLNERRDKEKQKATSQVREQIRRWNSGDVLLYDVFNQTLWEMIQLEGPDFFKDLAFFRKEKEAMQKTCLQEGHFLTNPFGGKIVQGYAVKPNIPKELKTICDKMAMNEIPYLKYLQEKLTSPQQLIHSSVTEPII